MRNEQAQKDFIQKLTALFREYKLSIMENDQYDSDDDYCGCSYTLVCPDFVVAVDDLTGLIEKVEREIK